MDDVDYAAWARYYLSLLGRAGVPIRRLAECACGTGSLTIELARAGAELVASDLSEEMLRIAADKARQAGVRVPFIRQDMRSLLLPRPVDAVLAACDGVNYLLSEADVRAFFAAAQRALRPGGALCFDISTRYKLEQIIGNAFFGETREDICYLWQNTYDPAAALLTMDVTFFTQQPDGRYRRLDEIHRQRAHTEAELRAWLAAEGFTAIETFGGQTPHSPQPQDERLHFLARKADAS